MKHIDFKKLTMQNFLSMGTEAVEINFVTGINFITGDNKDKEDSKNGVGKSTIIDALFFAIFGKTLRSLKNENIVNYFNKKKCVVELDFDVIENGVTTQYRIRRGLKPGKLVFVELVDGEEPKEETDDDKKLSRSKPETNKDIIKITGLEYEAFMYDTVNDFNNTVPFLAQKGVAKKKYIENTFSLSVFSVLTKLISTDYNTNSKKLVIKENVMAEIKTSLAEILKKKSELEAKMKNREYEVQQKIEKIKAEIDALKTKIKTADENRVVEIHEKVELLNTKMRDIKSREKEALTLKYQLDADITRLRKDIKTLQNKPDVCVSCNREYSDTDKNTFKESLDKLSKSLLFTTEKTKKPQAVINRVAELVDSFSTKITNYRTELDSIQTILRNNKFIGEKVELLSNQIASHKDSLKEEKKNMSFDSMIENNNKRMKENEIEIDELNETLNMIEVAKFVVSDDGAKSYLVNKLLINLNERISHYLKRMNSNCICIFDEYLEEKIYSEKMDEVTYYNFSGGERRRIDIAMLFAFIDIKKMRSNITTNIMMFDELFDSALDGKGIVDIMDILEDIVKKYNKSIYVISHRTEATQFATGEVVQLVKHNGFTRRITSGTI